MDLKESALAGRDAAAHWYYRSKAAAMMRALGETPARSILDVGAGSGFFARYLLERGAAHRALCVDIGYADERDESVCGRTLSFRRSFERSDADLVLLMDVLEHVDDDVGLLSSVVARASSPDARFLLTVPAHQWLWSAHDVFLGHRRRYTLRMLDHVVQRAGLRVVNSHYGFGLVLPVAMATRWWQRVTARPDTVPRSQLVRHGRCVDWTLGHVCAAELPLMQFNRFAGLSVFCLAARAM